MPRFWPIMIRMKENSPICARLTANGRAASLAPPGPLPWITEAKTALGRNEARDRTWLMDWLKRDGRS